MKMRIYNPKYAPYFELGETSDSWNGLKAKITAFLEANSDKQLVSIDEMRKLDPKFADQIFWNQIFGEMPFDFKLMVPDDEGENV